MTRGIEESMPTGTLADAASWAYGYLHSAVELFLDGTSDLETLSNVHDELMVCYLNRVTPLASGSSAPPVGPDDVVGGL